MLAEGMKGICIGSVLCLLLAAGAHGETAQRRAIAAAAESQAGVTRHYDPSYVKLKYPGGDVPIERGVCADVVVRAFRKIGVDLQVSLHEDMSRAFRAYPQRWRLRGPDSNIDHRRVANLMTFFKRQRKSIALHAPYEPGDVVAWRLSNGLLHIGVVSTRRADAGDHHLVVHNIGLGTRTEDVLNAFEIIGHYRW
ncbi:MAG: DUF1287 domain-containing protein [Thermoanaerobaculia bacterium]